MKHYRKIILGVTIILVVILLISSAVYVKVQAKTSTNQNSIPRTAETRLQPLIPAIETVVSITATSKRSKFMTPVTWTAEVYSPTGERVPEGYVSFITTSIDGTKQATIGVVKLENGIAKFTKKQFVPGEHPVYAVYSGSSVHIKSKSKIIELIVEE